MNAVQTEIKTVTVTHTKQARFRCVARVDMPEYGIVAGQRFDLVRVRGDQYEVKAIFVDEVEIDRSGNATYSHHNMAGVCYTSILRPNGHHECNCDAGQHGRGCYHRRILQAMELDEAKALHNRRIEMKQVAATRHLSSVEAGLSPFVMSAMAGRRNGYLSGKAA